MPRYYRRYARRYNPYRRSSKRRRLYRRRGARRIRRVIRRVRRATTARWFNKQKNLVPLTYADQTNTRSITLAAGVWGPYQNQVIYRANDIWDPDSSLGGTTVSGYSQFTSLFDEYQVTYAYITFNLYNVSGCPMMAFIYFTTDGVNLDFAATQSIETAKWTKFKYIGTLYEGKPHKIKAKVNMKRIIQNKYNDVREYYTAIGSSPTYPVYAHIGICAINTSPTGLANGTYVAITHTKIRMHVIGRKRTAITY